MNEYIRCVNKLVSEIVEAQKPIKLSSASFQAELPSAVKHEVINAAKSIVKKYKSGVCKVLPILKSS